MKVYIVTTGCYSDYRIEAVYDEANKDAADEHAKILGGEAEEYELNKSLPFPKGRAPYIVWYWVGGNSASASPFPGEWSDEIDKTASARWKLYVHAESPEHAAKIAMERVTREKALFAN